MEAICIFGHEMKRVFGLDIGGTGIKGGIVNVKKGVLETERIKLKTPRPATPDRVAEVTSQLLDKFDWDGPIGCGFPSIIKNNVCYTATNIEQDWIGVNVADLLTKATDMHTHVVNDADAAALCEMHFGAARGKKGLILVVTIGTGIGCGLIYDGVLVPNCELGVTYLNNGIMLEKYSSNLVRKTENLDWPTYGKRVNAALEHLHRLMTPDLLIIGGGMTKNLNYFKSELNPKLNIRAAQFGNDAGCIGAAMAYQN